MQGEGCRVWGAGCRRREEAARGESAEGVGVEFVIRGAVVR